MLTIKGAKHAQFIEFQCWLSYLAMYSCLEDSRLFYLKFATRFRWALYTLLLYFFYLSCHENSLIRISTASLQVHRHVQGPTDASSEAEASA